MHIVNNQSTNENYETFEPNANYTAGVEWAKTASTAEFTQLLKLHYFGEVALDAAAQASFWTAAGYEEFPDADVIEVFSRAAFDERGEEMSVFIEECAEFLHWNRKRPGSVLGEKVLDELVRMREEEVKQVTP